MQGELFGGSCLAGFEKQFRGPLSYQLNFGLMPFNANGNTNRSFLSLYFGLEGRYYFVLNKKDLEGIYVGPHFALHYASYFFRSPKSIATRIFWPQIGATLGYQKTVFHRLSLGIFANGGYTGKINFKSYRRDGALIGSSSDPLTISAFGGFSLGYKF